MAASEQVTGAVMTGKGVLEKPGEDMHPEEWLVAVASVTHRADQTWAAV